VFQVTADCHGQPQSLSANHFAQSESLDSMGSSKRDADLQSFGRLFLFALLHLSEVGAVKQNHRGITSRSEPGKLS
jgi:hypothetical protein